MPLREERETLRLIERRHHRLSALAEGLHSEHRRVRDKLVDAEEFLVLAPKARDRLEELTTALFGKILDEVEANLTHAIREILGQDRVVVTEREVKNNRLQIHFQIRNQGREEEIEDIMSGQGGSVCNILSVGAAAHCPFPTARGTPSALPGAGRAGLLAPARAHSEIHATDQ